jgi:protease-4
MALDPDVILDRRRLKRRVTLWRTIAVMAVAGLAALVVGEDFARPFARDHVASLDIVGIIIGDDATVQAIDAVVDNDKAQALIVFIDSPGGTTYGGETLYEAIGRVRQKKPVVAVIGGLGTSAGYLIALAADRILVRQTSVTGSIGVLIETAEVSRLLDKLGIATDAVKSGPLKDTPSPLQPMTREGRAVVQGLVDDSYDWFVGLVAERRGLPREAARTLADGRVYTGRQALAAKLVDELGATREARRWLEEQHGIPATLPVKSISLPSAPESALDWLTGLAKKMVFSERLRLDGLKSVWQPDRL